MEMTKTLPSLQEIVSDNESIELRRSIDTNVSHTCINAVLHLSALISLGEYEHARHLCRRNRCHVSSSNHFACKALEVMWEITKLLMNDNVESAFAMLKKMESDFSPHSEILSAIESIKNALFTRRAAFLARSFSKVEVVFAAKELGFENSVEELLAVLMKEGWSVHDRDCRRFLVPPEACSIGKTSIQGNDALDRMIEVVTFMECKRLNE